MDTKQKKTKKTELDFSKIGLIMLIGLSGSGKSTFTNHLMKETDYCGVTQDDCGNRSDTEDKIIKLVKKNKKVVLDRTNLIKTDRLNWIKLFNDNNKATKRKILYVVFNIPIEICIKNAQKRKDHNLKPQKAKKVILNSLSAYEKPDISESDKIIKIIEIVNYNQVDKLLVLLGAKPVPDKFYAFPKTEHIIDVGKYLKKSKSAVTRDDLLVDKYTYDQFINNKKVSIEEKIDGANMGITVNKENQLIFFNRSHTVSHETSTQFGPLKEWKDKFSTQLYDVLKNKYIIYGEWCTVKHSIYYDKLPDYFVVFDIFNKRNEKFLSRKAIEKKLLDTDLKLVPFIEEVKVPDLEYLIKKFGTISNFASKSKLEGLVLKINDGKYNVFRAKIVDPEFIQNIDVHWTKKEVVKNKICFELKID